MAYPMGLALTLLALGAQEPGRVDRSLVDAVASGYRSNLASFRFGHLEADYFVGRADSLEDAQAGRWSLRVGGRQALWFQGDDARYQLLFTPEDIVAHRTKIDANKYSTILPTSTRLLTDGRKTMFDTIWVADLPDDAPKGAPIDPEFVYSISQIAAGAQSFARDVVLPIGLGLKERRTNDLDQYIEQASGAGGPMKITAAEPADIDGREGVALTFTFDTPPFETRVLVDLERGCLPVRWEAFRIDDGKPIQVETTLLLDLKQAGQGGWYPTRQVGFAQGNAAEWVLTSAQFDRPPLASVFALDFPRPVKMLDQATNVRYNEPRSRWSLRDLPSPSGPLAEKLLPSEPQGAPPTLPGPVASRPVWPYAVLGVGVLLLLLTLGRYAWRRSHEAS